MLAGCGSHHTSIVGKWLCPVGAGGKSGVVYEFRADGTMSHYSQVDVSDKLPGTGLMTTPKFTGPYAFRSGVLTYHLTGDEYQGKSETFGKVRMPDQTYQAEVGGDTLTLQQEINGSSVGQPEEYTRQ